MTGNPSHDEAIKEFVSRVNTHHGGCTVKMAWDFIRGMGYDDPGRELRRLYEEGQLRRENGHEYYVKKTIMMQGIGRFL